MKGNVPQNKSRNILIIVIVALSVIAMLGAVIFFVLPHFFPDDSYASVDYDNPDHADEDDDRDNSADGNSTNNYYDTYFEDEYDKNAQLRHAPNMYVDWVSTSDYSGSYDAFIIDWKCTETADGTYWAVHEWDEGYAGFQDRGEDCDVVLLSLWDLPDGTQPRVEYYHDDYDYGDFTHEGCGAYVFTPYDWEVGVWYSMKIEITYEDNKTIFTQYVCKDGEDWLKTAAISYSAYVEVNRPTHVFQEDYFFNDMPRSCMLRNASGRFSETGEWDHWNEFIVDSSYYPDENDENALWSISFGCDYEIGNDTVEIFSGGRGNIPGGKQMPYDGSFN